jgi:hypothetical protein
VPTERSRNHDVVQNRERVDANFVNVKVTPVKDLVFSTQDADSPVQEKTGKMQQTSVK